ncbi:MAG: hypothetical protein M5U26_14615 [Planctomycetota bacterium]|nr:hypothetical protein [Planctomycetota bacterium]
MSLAHQQAIRLGHDYIGVEHLLLGFLEHGKGVGACVLENLNCDLGQMHQSVLARVQAASEPLHEQQLPFTARAKKILEYALDEAKAMDHNYVGTEHLLLGMLRLDEGFAFRTLCFYHLDYDTVRAEILDFLGSTDKQDA